MAGDRLVQHLSYSSINITGQFEEAASLFLSLVHSRPDDSTVRMNLALANYRQRDQELASLRTELEDIFRDVSSSKKYSYSVNYVIVSLLFICVCLLAGNDFDSSEHVVLLYNMAVCYFWCRQLAKAYSIMNKVASREIHIARPC